MHKLLWQVFVTVGFLIAFSGLGARPSVSADVARYNIQQDTQSRRIDLIHADSLFIIKVDSSSIRRLIGNVQLKQGNTYFTCDSAIQYMPSNRMEAFGKVHINQNDSIHTYSDYLLYLGESKMASLQGNAKLTDQKIVLTSPEIQYNLIDRIGTYANGGKLVNEQSVLTSTHGIYYANTKDVYFKDQVVIIDPEFTLSTDTLLYNTESKVATIMAPTTINDGNSTMYVSKGFYHTEQGIGYFSERPLIEDSVNTFTAQNIETNRESGISIATGDMVWKDTVQKISVLANYGIIHQHEKSVLATQKPIVVLESSSDTLFMAADTLYSALLTDSMLLAKTPELVNSDSTEYRYVLAYPNVKIFSDSLQGAAGNVYYDTADSTIRMAIDPVLWANDVQLTGDSIYLYTRQNKADRLLLQQNAFIITEVGTNMYNQVKGNTIMGYFSNDQLDSAHVNGNAENVYYIMDSDSAIIGINRLQSASTHIYFENGELERVVFIKTPEGTEYPFNQMPEDRKLLQGFKWLTERRPKSKFELIEN
jgi:lipopolysaccharide export system protein LptA